MSETPRLKLPLVQSSQAQKHVTVNEAFVLLDGLAQLVLEDVGVTAPPSPVVDGTCYSVGLGATGSWSGMDGSVAIGTNGGWLYVTPVEGWRAWVVASRSEVQWSGGVWSSAPLGQSLSGAQAVFTTLETEHDVASGGQQSLTATIPSNAMVFAVSSRVLDALTGDLTSWQLGTAGAEDRFGSGMGLSGGSYSSGVLGSPTTYYSPAPLVLTPIGGTFSGGRLRVVRHMLKFDLPGA